MEDTLELRWYFSILRRWLWLIVVCTLLGATGVYLVSSRMPPVYSASVTLLVHQAPGTSMSEYTAIRASELLASTYSQMLRGRAVLEAVIVRLGLEETPGALAKRVKTELVPETQLIRLKVEHADPNMAALIANTIAETFIVQNEALQEGRYAESLASMQIQIFELSALIDETQVRIDDLHAPRTVQEQPQLARLETILAGYRSTYATLQQNYEQMRLTMVQSTNNVIVVETAQVLGQEPEGLVQSRYSGSATLLVRQAPGSGTSDYNAILRLARTYSQMLSGRPVLEAAISLLGLEETPDELARRVKAELVPDTQLIRLSVEDTDLSQATLIAHTIAEVFIAQIEALQEEQYAGSLATMQEQMVELLTLIEETQAEIDALHAKTAQGEPELARLENILAGYRSTYATLQQNYEQMRLTMAQAIVNMIVVEMAQVPKNPIQRRTLYTTLAAVAGTMLALGVAFLLEYLDDTIKTPDDVSQALGLGTFGTISRLTRKEEELVVAAQPLSPTAEAFRALCTNIRFSSMDKPLRTLLVTSAGPSEGKSTALANLAAAMVKAGYKVVAVDADLRRPRLHQLFDLGPREGVSRKRLWWGLTGSLLEGHTNGLLQPTQVEGLRFLPSGELPPNPAEVVGSQHMRELLAELAQQVDMVLIDSAPVLPVADATALAPAVDGVLLVVEAGKTRREDARHAVKGLRQVGANLVGVVLNKMPLHRGSYYLYNEANGNGRGRRKHRLRRQKGSLTVAQRLFGRRQKADAD